MPHQSHSSTLRRCTEKGNFYIPLLEVRGIKVASFPRIRRNGLLEIIEIRQAHVEVGIDLHEAYRTHLQ
jgi:hypothetical protein